MHRHDGGVSCQFRVSFSPHKTNSSSWYSLYGRVRAPISHIYEYRSEFSKD